jgi:hypothetical protein
MGFYGTDIGEPVRPVKMPRFDGADVEAAVRVALRSWYKSRQPNWNVARTVTHVTDTGVTPPGGEA